MRNFNCRDWKLAFAGGLALLMGACGGGTGGFFGGSVSLDAKATSISTIRLSWSKPSGGLTVSSYGVARDDARGSYTLEWTTNRTYTVTGLEPGTEYCFVIRMPITANKISDRECATTFADRLAPSMPGNLQATAVSAAAIHLTWSRSTDEGGVAGYEIYRDGSLLKTSQTTGVGDSPLQPQTEYCYRVAAFDRAGNRSRQSAAACATTPEDLEPPTVPTNLRAEYSAGTGAIELTWTNSTDDGMVAFYKVYRDGGYLADAEGQVYSDVNLEGERLYCYTLVAADVSGKASGESDEVCVRSSWQSRRLDGQHSDWADIAVDSNQQAHIAYKRQEYNSTAGRTLVWLKYLALSAAGTGTSRTLREGYEAFWFSDGLDVAVAIDPNDNVGIVHKINTSDYSVAEKIEYVQPSSSGGIASLATVQETEESMNSVSLASDSNGVMHACYSLKGRVIYAHNASGAWSADAEMLAGGVNGRFCEIAVDARGAVHISYTTTEAPLDLNYLTNASGAWEVVTVDAGDPGTSSGYRETSIAVDGAGNVHIVFSNDGVDLEYATNAGGAWQTRAIAPLVGSGTYLDMAIGVDGRVHVVYRDFQVSGKVLYATNANGSWESGPLWSLSRGNASVAVDAAGYAHVVVASGVDGWLTYLTNRPD